MIFNFIKNSVSLRCLPINVTALTDLIPSGDPINETIVTNPTLLETAIQNLKELATVPVHRKREHVSVHGN